jgi:hypothetical protein
LISVLVARHHAARPRPRPEANLGRDSGLLYAGPKLPERTLNLPGEPREPEVGIPGDWRLKPVVLAQFRTIRSIPLRLASSTG